MEKQLASSPAHFCMKAMLRDEETAAKLAKDLIADAARAGFLVEDMRISGLDLTLMMLKALAMPPDDHPTQLKGVPPFFACLVASHYL